MKNRRVFAVRVHAIVIFLVFISLKIQVYLPIYGYTTLKENLVKH